VDLFVDDEQMQFPSASLFALHGCICFFVSTFFFSHDGCQRPGFRTVGDHCSNHMLEANQGKKLACKAAVNVVQAAISPHEEPEGRLLRKQMLAFSCMKCRSA
jgi:hypothetical protein